MTPQAADQGNARSPIARGFAANLLRCREAAGLSQEELGIRASPHRTEISRLERGLRVARIDTLGQAGGSLQVCPEALLVGLGWSPGTTRQGGFSNVPFGTESKLDS